MKGSAPLFRRFFDENPVSGPTPWLSAKHQDFHPFTNNNLAWYKAQGCELVKMCAEPGDVILWDSREVHWAKYSDSDVLRTLIYATYTPASWMTPEDQILKKEMFEKTQTTTHWPHCNLYTHGGATIKVDGKDVPDPLDRTEPVTKPDPTDKLLKLAGVIPY